MFYNKIITLFLSGVIAVGNVTLPGWCRKGTGTAYPKTEVCSNLLRDPIHGSVPFLSDPGKNLLSWIHDALQCCNMYPRRVCVKLTTHYCNAVW